MSTTILATLGHYCADGAELAPNAPLSAARLLAMLDYERGYYGNNEGVSTVLTEVAKLQELADVASARIGDICPERAAHVWQMDVPRFSAFAEPATANGRAPDAYSAVRSDVVARQNTKRVTRHEVKRHGRAYVIGDTRPDPRETDTAIALPITTSALLSPREYVHDPAGAGYWRGVMYPDGRGDGIALARLATVAYGLPELLGGDVVSWEDVSAPVAEPWNLSSAGHCGLSGEPGSRDGWPEHWSRMPDGTWRGEPVSLVPPSVKRRPPRLRLRRPVPRKRDPRPPAPRTRVRGLGPSGPRPSARFTVHSLIASHTDADRYIWHGHRKVRRGERVRDTRHGKRAARRIAVRVIPDAQNLGDALGAIADTLTAGQSVEWQWRGLSGAVSMTPRGQMTVSGAGLRVRGMRRGSTLAKRVTRQLATL